MSLLTSFLLSFNTDAKEAKEEVEGLSGALGDTEESAQGAAGGLDDVTESANTNAESIGDLTGMMFKLGAAYLSFDAIASGIFDNAMNIDTVGKFSQTLGLNIVEVDAWGAAVERNGGSAEGFRSTVDSLTSSLADMTINGANELTTTLGRLGISATDSGGKIKSAFDVLPEIAAAFEGMSNQKSVAFGKKLGLDQGTILTLQQSRHEVDKLVERQKMLSGVTEEGYESAALFNDAWDDTKRVFNSLWMSTNSVLLPALTSTLGALENVVLWVRENQTLVEGFFIGVAVAVTAIYLPAIASAAAATLLLLEPFILIGAAIAGVGVAIAILYEDITAYVNGAPSFLGDMAEESKLFKDILDGTINVVKMLFQAFKDLSHFTVSAFLDPLEAIDTISRKAAELFSFIGNAGSMFDGFFGDDEVNATQTNTSAALNTMSVYSANPLNNGGGAQTNNRSNTYNIEVGGATINASGMSEQQAKNVFAYGMRDQVEMAIGQLNDGTDR